VLEPGVRLGGLNGQGSYRMQRHGVHFTLIYAEAVTLGWIWVE
jgi:hypothetical protein